MLGRIKYKLFSWLMNDICRKSSCCDCEMETRMLTCLENSVFVQARRAWGLEALKCSISEKEER